MKLTGVPAFDSVIILYDSIKELFTRKKKQLSREEKRKKLEKELSFVNATFMLVFLFAVKAVLYFSRDATGKGIFASVAAVLGFFFLMRERNKYRAKLNALKTAEDFTMGSVAKVPHIGKAERVANVPVRKR